MNRSLSIDDVPAHARHKPFTRAHWRTAALLLLTAVLTAGVSVRHPAFAGPQQLAETIDDTSILMLLAIGQMLVLLTRCVDLSVASNLALSGMMAALFNRSYPDAGAACAIAIAVASGTVLGALNGVLVWRLRLPAIVVTLGTLSIYRGTIFVITEGEWVNSHELSGSFLSLMRHAFLGLTWSAWLSIVAAVTAACVLSSTVAGRRLYAVGGNPSAAAYVGIDAGRMQFAAFTICGALAGLCGYLWVARFAVAYTDIAFGFELQVIAACLLGGVSIAGGVGVLSGVVAGCLFLGVIKNALPVLGISPFWQMGVNGLVITIAAALNARMETTAGKRGAST